MITNEKTISGHEKFKRVHFVHGATYVGPRRKSSKISPKVGKQVSKRKKA